MTRCPTCRAKYNGEAVCYRCKSDLSALLNIEEQAAVLRKKAMTALQNGNLKEASEAIEKSLSLQNAKEGRRIKALLQAHAGEFRAVLDEMKP